MSVKDTEVLARRTRLKKAGSDFKVPRPDPAGGWIYRHDGYLYWAASLTHLQRMIWFIAPAPGEGKGDSEPSI